MPLAGVPLAAVDGSALDLALAPATDVPSACAVVVGVLAARDGHQAGAYLERSGRLRCQASAGGGHLLDGIPVAAGPIGLALRSGEEQLVDGLEGIHQAACLPLVVFGSVVGVLVLAGNSGIGAGELDTVRAAAGSLGRRIEQLGGAPDERAASRLAQHISAVAALDDPARVERAALIAALDLAGMQSGAFVAHEASGRMVVRCSAGPLARSLDALPAGALETLADVLAGGASIALRGGERAGGPELPAPLAALRGLGAASAVAVPVAARGELTGALVLADPRALVLGTDTIELLELLAVQVGSALRAADAVAELRHRASTDPLTGLGHRGAFDETLAASHRRPINTAVALCDVDSFKALNDSRGHQEGDRALLAVAAALQGSLRRGDSLYRLGGDEFAALLAVRNESEALAAAQRMRDAVLRAQIGVTVSVGVAVPSLEETDVALIGRADRALYAVKDAGRDGVALAPPAGSATAR